jgi:hypothetical protein
VALLLVIYLVRPAKSEASLTFRVLFAGVENGQYPNGTRFTPSDIVSTAVLQEVYNRNTLQELLPFERFKSSFAVIESNPALGRLHREYQERLGARGLSAVDRKQLEDEYESRVRSLRSGEFTLVAALGKGTQRWPETLAGKVAVDVLDVWAEQSRGRGVFRFDLSVFSENILPTATQSEDYLILTDRLRLTLQRVLRNISALSLVPSARLARVGPEAVSLGEMEAEITDTLRYRLGMIEGAIASFGFYRNRPIAEAYINEQLFRLQLQASELQSRARAIEEAHTTYASGRAANPNSDSRNSTIANPLGGGNPGNPMITQLGDSFLDRIMELSTRGSDNVFRQTLLKEIVELGHEMAALETERKIYERKLELLRSEVTPSQSREEAGKWLNEQIAQVINDLRSALRNLQLLHLEISQRQLQPSNIFTVEAGLKERTVSPISMTKMAALLLAGWLIYVGLCVVLLTWRVIMGRP